MNDGTYFDAAAGLDFYLSEGGKTLEIGKHGEVVPIANSISICSARSASGQIDIRSPNVITVPNAQGNPIQTYSTNRGVNAGLAAQLLAKFMTGTVSDNNISWDGQLRNDLNMAIADIYSYLSYSSWTPVLPIGVSHHGGPAIPLVPVQVVT